MLSGNRIVLGVTGGIAAYRAAELASLLKKGGAEAPLAGIEGGDRGGQGAGRAERLVLFYILCVEIIVFL